MEVVGAGGVAGVVLLEAGRRDLVHLRTGRRRRKSTCRGVHIGEVEDVDAPKCTRRSAIM